MTGPAKRSSRTDDGTSSPLRKSVTLELLREDRLAAEFICRAEAAKAISIAAPFWGEGAAERLGLPGKRQTRILCRFDSPACNPTELLALARAGATIRTNPRLHAKVYLAGEFAIIGSSNPSRFGVTEEGDTVGGTIEANILTDDPDVVAQARQLFEELWEAKATAPISKAIIEREIAQRAIEPPPMMPRQLTARTLLAACREAPALFSSVFVCAYDKDLGRSGKQAVADLQRQAADSDPELDAASFRSCWAYQFDEPPPPGIWIVDLDCRRKAPVVHGASQVPSPALRLKIQGEDDLTPTVRGIVAVPGAHGRFKIAGHEKEDLTAVARNLLLEKRALVPLAEVVARIDRRRNRERSSEHTSN